MTEKNDHFSDTKPEKTENSRHMMFGRRLLNKAVFFFLLPGQYLSSQCRCGCVCDETVVNDGDGYFVKVTVVSRRPRQSTPAMMSRIDEPKHAKNRM